MSQEHRQRGPGWPPRLRAPAERNERCLRPHARGRLAPRPSDRKGKSSLRILPAPPIHIITVRERVPAHAESLLCHSAHDSIQPLAPHFSPGKLIQFHLPEFLVGLLFHPPLPPAPGLKAKLSRLPHPRLLLYLSLRTHINPQLCLSC